MRLCLALLVLGLAGCAVPLAPTARPAADRAGALHVEPAPLAELDSLAGSYYRLTEEAGHAMARFYGDDLGGPEAVAGWLETLREAGAALEAAYFTAGGPACDSSEEAPEEAVPPQLVLRLRVPWADAQRHGFEPGRAVACREAALRFTPAN